MAKKGTRNDSAQELIEEDDDNGSDISHAPPVWSRKMWTGSANIEVAVFSRDVTKENRTFTVYNVTARRTYRKNNEYLASVGFRGDDVPTVIQLLSQAYGFIAHALQQKSQS